MYKHNSISYLNQRVGLFKPKKIIINDFLYHWLDKESINFCRDFGRASAQPNISWNDISETLIPVPLLEIQEKIVNFLNLFTELNTELNTEYTKRKKQYEWYLKILFDFENKKHIFFKEIGNNLNYENLSSVSKIIRGQRITKKDLVENGKYPVISGGKGILGYTDEYNRDPNTITIAQYGTAGYVNWQYDKFYANDVCFSIYPDTLKLNNRFLYFFLMMKQDYIYRQVNTEAIPYHLETEKLNNIKVPVISLEIQQKIVDILDKFNTLTNDINIGLPKEIELNNKRYQYYKEKLLSFKNKKQEK